MTIGTRRVSGGDEECDGCDGEDAVGEGDRVVGIRGTGGGDRIGTDGAGGIGGGAQGHGVQPMLRARQTAQFRSM